MRILVAIVVLLLVIAGGAFAWAMRYPALEPIAPPSADAFAPDVVERGETLAGVGACRVCHTRPGGEAYAGGLALETPFGVIYATNITPDAATGIGAWSAEAFRRALHQGVDREGRYLYPAFPYDHFTKVTDEDSDAIYAYLMSLDPVDYRPPETDLGFPFNQRLLMAGWNLLFLDEGRYEPDPEKSESWNRGAYLVEGLGHCAACHTPRNALGAADGDRAFAGARVEGWYAPGLGARSPAAVPWTEDAMVNYLLDGWDADHGIAAGPMTPVVDELLYGSEDDAYAIAGYMVSLQPEAGDAESARAFAADRAFGGAGTPVEGPAIDAGAEAGLAEGASTFARICANCHRAGTRTAPLGLSSDVNGADPSTLIHVVHGGIQQPPEGSFDRTMPALGGSLTDEQLTNLVMFVRSHFSRQPAWEGVAERVREIRGD